MFAVWFIKALLQKKVAEQTVSAVSIFQKLKYLKQINKLYHNTSYIVEDI